MELDPDQLRWLRMARLAAFCSLLLFLVAVIVVAFLDARENGAENLPLTLWTVPLWLPYLWMYLQMKSRSTKRRKKGLALAVGYGAWALLIAAPSALESTGAALQGGFALFAACHWRITESGQNHGFFRVCYHAKVRDFVILFIHLIPPRGALALQVVSEMAIYQQLRTEAAD